MQSQDENTDRMIFCLWVMVHRVTNPNPNQEVKIIYLMRMSKMN